MVVSADGSYKAATTRGVETEGKFYLQDGQASISIVCERQVRRDFPKTRARRLSR